VPYSVFDERSAPPVQGFVAHDRGFFPRLSALKRRDPTLRYDIVGVGLRRYPATLRTPSMKVSALAAILAIVTLSRAAAAGPEARVRVHGASHLDATATSSARGAELSGRLVDDSGRAIPDARIRVRWHTDAGPRPLPRPLPCGAVPPRSGGPSEAGDEALAFGDDNGRFCLRWPIELPSGHLALEFEDEHKLLDPTRTVVELDRRPALALEFAPPPRLLSADDAEVTVVLQARGSESESEHAQVNLSFSRVGAKTTSLARGELRPNEALRLSFSPRALGGPGPGELTASADFGARTAQARAPVSVTAKVLLDLPNAAEANADGEAWLDVKARSVFGPVRSGSVEAVVAGRTAGIAAVEHGAAHLPLRLPPIPGESTVSVRYLSAAPWWVPAGSEDVTVTVLRGAPWKWLPWAAGLAGIAAWLLLAWRRPERSEVRELHAPAPKGVEPELEWLSANSGQKPGWSGRVVDAHDGQGIAEAKIRIASPHGSVLETFAAADGTFRIEQTLGELHGGVIGVEAPWHARLERPLPPPGHLTISLVTRRRALLARLVEWADRRRPRLGPPEPTPAELERAAGQRHPDIATWAAAVEAAAFGPNAVDAEREAEVDARKPPT
jgi:hypothetical protein